MLRKQQSIAKTLCFTLLTYTITLLTQTTAQAQEDLSISPSLNQAEASSRISKYLAGEANRKSKSNSKLSSRLTSLQINAKGNSQNFNHSYFVRTKNDNSVQVYISLANNSAATLEKLDQSVIELEIVNKNLKKAQAWVDIDQLNELAAQKWVKKITEPNYATVRQGSRLTEGDAILLSNTLRERGVTGEGIKVGILSDGALNFRDAVASGDLPANFREFGQCTSATDGSRGCGGTGGSGSCNEGTAMAEIIHDIAPDAELAVAAVNTSLEFVNQANVLANTFGANIIVDDLGFFGEPYFEDGDIARGMNALPPEILLVSSAGNSGQSHHEENFRFFFDSGSNLVLHDFSPSFSGDLSHGFVIQPNGSTVILTQWNENFDFPSSDFDIVIVDFDGNLVTSSVTQDAAIEAVCVENNSNETEVFFVFVVLSSGPGARLESFFLGASAIEYPIDTDSIFGHSGLPRTLSVAAINADEQDNDEAAFYSSRGPSTVFRPRFEVRNKPDLAAIDGVSVTGAGGFPSRFFGTSAAAPHAAGIAALLMSAGPNVTAEKVRQAMIETAVGGTNNSLGAGRINAEEAFKALALGNPAPILLLLLGDEED